MTDDVKQDWSYIDKWFDDYGHTLEPRDLARWAYSNGMWQQVKGQEVIKIFKAMLKDANAKDILEKLGNG